ncbi:YbaY family lipoprotein [Chloroflexus sp.]|uniref:YbaY family lipoprotein n=1 Tax=Chloroflexus sp. TaxID=1904827 RepID=UPI0026188308|nr:YbaY family lipoprotein [uncultured Chloroflexus sp.]
MQSCRRIFVVLIGLWWLTIPALTVAQGTANLTGIITYRERVLLPADALVTLQIAEVTPTGSGGRVIVEQTFATNGAQPPFRFNLAYNPALIDAGRVYTLQGRIQVQGRTLFTTASLIPVITGNAPRSDINVVMVAVRGATLPAAGSALWMLGLAGSLGIAGMIMHLARRTGRYWRKRR